MNEKELTDILTVLRENNISRRVYVSYEGSKKIPLSKEALVEDILEELRWTTKALKTGDTFNKPPFSKEELEVLMETDIAHELGYNSLEEYREERLRESEEFMKEFLKRGD